MLKGEWKKLLSNRLMLVVVLAVIAIPTIYTTLFLGSMWDPYGSVENLPVALVNQDQPVEYEGKTLNVGGQLVENLQEDASLDFRLTDADDAAQGLADGTYYMVITIPQDFSSNAATLTDEQPREMELEYETNPGTNYIASKLSETAMKEIQAGVREEVTKTYAETMFDQLAQVGDGMQEAADGAGEIQDGTRQLADGNNTIRENLELLADSTLTFRSGSAGASNLETGLYLLVIDTFTTEDGIWNVSCKPTLLPVPVVNGEVNGSWDGSDNYDVTAALKLTAEKALTKIKITKQLTDYSALQGPASFVFRVEAVNAGGENVFSNVYAMTFTGAAAQELVIENIPVDSTVTVTEVYSGASYTPDGSGEIQLTARPMVKNNDGSETLPAENEAAFVNRYNRRRTYGTAVTNAFSYADGQWQLTQNYSNK